MTKNPAGKERIYSSYTSTLLLSTKVGQDRNSSRARQELMQRPQRNVVYRLSPHGLLRLLSYRIQGHQARDGTPHNMLSLPPLIKCLTAKSQGGNSSTEPPSSDDSSLCQADTQPASTSSNTENLDLTNSKYYPPI